MKLVYYQSAAPNFGDDMNLDLWPALRPVLFDGDESTGFVGIGTIIGKKKVSGCKKLLVFSSGVGYDPIDNWKDIDVRYSCVRGPLSAKLLGLNADLALTDGAVLTPLVSRFPQMATPGDRGIVIPHWESIHYGGWPETAAAADLDLVDPRGTPESVIAKISRAKFVLTESLHGAIIAEIYRIPWVAFTVSKNFNIFKWVDWTQTVGRKMLLTPVPPPTPEPLLEFGRPAAPFGTTMEFGPETALGTYKERVLNDLQRINFRDRPKAFLRRFNLLQRILPYSSARTAEALNLLSTKIELSAQHRTQEYQERMIERLNHVDLK